MCVGNFAQYYSRWTNTSIRFSSFEIQILVLFVQAVTVSSLKCMVIRQPGRVGERSASRRQLQWWDALRFPTLRYRISAFTEQRLGHEKI